jgi:serine/threonine protein kinase
VHSLLIDATTETISAGYNRERAGSICSDRAMSPLSVHSVGSNSMSNMNRTQPPSIKEYEILKPISKGAFGAVYLAKKRVTGEVFAIKVLKKSDMISKNQVTNVKAERMILTRLDSPFVVKLFFSFQSRDNLYLVMEYLNGGDCSALLKKVGNLDEDWTRQYIAELTMALGYLHENGIIHR